MQKKLISAAIASALAIPGAAMADITSNSGITVYGKFHASWDYVDVGANAIDDTDDNTAVFRNSRLGFKGSEDLGSGLSAIWQIETHIDTDDDANNANNTGNVGLRNTFIGLQGDNWGKIILGRHDTPYKTATAKLDIFSDTIADYNNIIGSHMATGTGGTTGTISTFNEREPQVAIYETPNFNGFKAQVARGSVQFDEDTNVAAGAEDLEAWSLMGMYDQGPFFASLAYEVYSGWSDDGGASGWNSSAGNEEIDAWKLGLGYTFGNSTLGFVYEDIEHDDSVNNNEMSRDAYWAAFSHTFGANVLNLAYGKANESDFGDQAGNNKDGADTWAIGIDHNFSKRTKIYAIYTDMDNDAGAAYSLSSFDNTANYVGAAAGDDSDAFSVGIIHNF